MQNNDIGEFVEHSYGNNQGIALHFGEKPANPNDPFESILSNLTDGDRGEFVPPGFDAPKACNSSIFSGDFSSPLPGTQNQSGSVVVNLTKVSYLGNNSFGSTPPYGLIRFRIKID